MNVSHLLIDNDDGYNGVQVRLRPQTQAEADHLLSLLPVTGQHLEATCDRDPNDQRSLIVRVRVAGSAGGNAESRSFLSMSREEMLTECAERGIALKPKYPYQRAHLLELLMTDEAKRANETGHEQ